jgi:hypothetical protein
MEATHGSVDPRYSLLPHSVPAAPALPAPPICLRSALPAHSPPTTQTPHLVGGACLQQATHSRGPRSMSGPAWRGGSSFQCRTRASASRHSRSDPFSVNQVSPPCRASTPPSSACPQAGGGGFEPPHTDSESAVLPLDEPPASPPASRNRTQRRVPRRGLEPPRPFGHRSSTCRVCLFRHRGICRLLYLPAAACQPKALATPPHPPHRAPPRPPPAPGG